MTVTCSWMCGHVIRIIESGDTHFSGNSLHLYLSFSSVIIYIVLACTGYVITSPLEGVARYCFHPVCLSVCLSVRPIFWYFISRLLEEISIWNVYRIPIGLYSIHWKKIDLYRSKVKVTGMIHYFLKIQSYISQKLSHRKISIFFHRHLLGYSIRWNNINLSEQRNDVTKICQYLTLTCRTPIPKLLPVILIKLSIKI